jgi:hypothetical protein
VNYGISEWAQGGGAGGDVCMLGLLMRNCSFDHVNFGIRTIQVSDGSHGETIGQYGVTRRNLTFTNVLTIGWVVNPGSFINLDIWQDVVMSGDILYAIANAQNVYPINVTLGTVVSNRIGTSFTGDNRASSIGVHVGTGYSFSPDTTTGITGFLTP